MSGRSSRHVSTNSALPTTTSSASPRRSSRTVPPWHWRATSRLAGPARPSSSAVATARATWAASCTAASRGSTSSARERASRHCRSSSRPSRRGRVARASPASCIATPTASTIDNGRGAADHRSGCRAVAGLRRVLRCHRAQSTGARTAAVTAHRDITRLLVGCPVALHVLRPQWLDDGVPEQEPRARVSPSWKSSGGATRRRT